MLIEIVIANVAIVFYFVWIYYFKGYIFTRGTVEVRCNGMYELLMALVTDNNYVRTCIFSCFILRLSYYFDFMCLVCWSTA